MGESTWTATRVESAASLLEGKSPEVVLAWAFKQFAIDEIALACSFGAEDVALVALISRIRPGSLAFYLDTDVLFPETYELIRRIEDRYPITLEQYRPQITLAEQADLHGEALWHSEPDGCCAIRKVEPLKRALAERKAWITGIRREQSATRANARIVEWDQKFNLLKLNPLAAWTDKDLWEYILACGVPYNVLHDQGYPSIGCIHCTRAVQPGEEPRAGRWSGQAKTECGLHK